MKTQRRKAKIQNESDSVYILKLILYIFLGALWLRVKVSGSDRGVPIPIGFLVGLLFASHDHFQIDRKIEYALLISAMLISFFLPFGIVLAL
jgi:hypothetical protein